MDNNSASIISKVWSFCHTLRDDGVGYGDYLEQLTYLLFLKMADEYSKPPYSRRLPVPKEYNWESLVSNRGADLELHYSILLRELGLQKGILGQIFTKSQNKIQDPAKLYKLIDMINLESWVVMGADVKGDIYEGLLESELSVAETDLGVDAKTRAYVPVKAKTPVVVREGGVYLHNASGARKASGAYYTKEFAVEHLLDRALEPALDDHFGNRVELLPLYARLSAEEQQRDEQDDDELGRS